MREQLALDVLEAEEKKVGSWNHSLIQSRLIHCLSQDKRFVVPVELSLDTSQADLTQFGLNIKELIPDICVYPNSKSSMQQRDILRMSEMPLLAIEVLSPKQSVDDILAKFEAYFVLGIQSCWLVIPATKSISIYHSLTELQTFGTDACQIVDKRTDIHLNLLDVFA